MNELDEIMRLMDVSFEPRWGEAWTRRQVSDALVMPHTRAILMNAGGQVCERAADEAAGFVLSRHAADEEELLLIAVDPTLRGRGIGRSLIEALFDASKDRGVKSVFLEMRKGNPAENLYAEMGFRPIGERRDYYRLADGSRLDAITFGRSI